MSKMACQSSTYLAFFEELGHLKQVSGLCGMEYVQSENLAKQLENLGRKRFAMAKVLSSKLCWT